MRVDIITLFPQLIEPFLKEGIISRAVKQKKLKVRLWHLRDFALGAHQIVDDRPFGGGRGMVLKIEPVYRAVKRIRLKRKDKSSLFVVFTPRGKKFTQKLATRWAQLDQLILFCGRYEGIDERVLKYMADEKISIGPYVLMGGEIPALTILETVARLLPGIIGHSEQLKERITKKEGFEEFPQYTRPEIFEINSEKKWRVPKVLLSGDHKKIKEWRKKHSKIIE